MNQPTRKIFTLPTITVTATRDCPFGCNKTGIPILPVVFGRKAFNLHANDLNYFDFLPLTAHEPVADALSSLPVGYLYLYIEEDEQWTGYGIGADGQMQRFYPEVYTQKPEEPTLAATEKSAAPNAAEIEQPQNCTSRGHNNLAPQFITVDVYSAFWIAFSHVEWTVEVLRQYQSDSKLRQQRMVHYDPTQKAQHQRVMPLDQQQLPLLKQYMQSRYSKQNQLIEVPMRHPNGIGHAEQDAKQLLAKMNAALDPIDREEGYQPLMIALPDPMGMTIAANTKRNDLLYQLSQAIAPDEDSMRQRINALIIQRLKEQLEKNASYQDKGLWEKTKTLLNNGFGDQSSDDLIYKHIDRAGWEAALRPVEAELKIKTQIREARSLYMSAMQSEQWQFIQRHDFDADEFRSAQEHQRIISYCIAGMGVDEQQIGLPQDLIQSAAPAAMQTGLSAQAEFDRLFRPMFDANTAPEDNWLFRSLTGLNSSCTQLIQEFQLGLMVYDFSKQDRGSEGVSAGFTILRQHLERHLAHHLDAKRQAKIKIETQRIRAEYFNVIVDTVTANAYKLYKSDIKGFFTAIQAVEVGLYGATELRVQHAQITAKPEQVIQATQRMLEKLQHSRVFPAWGKRQAHKAQAVLDSAQDILEQAKDRRIRNQLPEPLRNLGSDADLRPYMLGYLEKATSTGKGHAALQQLSNGKALTTSEQAVDVALNHWGGRLGNAAISGSGAAFSSVVVLFQYHSIIGALDTLDRLSLTGSNERLETQLGTISTTITLMVASMDVVAGSSAAAGSVMSESSALGARAKIFAGTLSGVAGGIGLVGAAFEMSSAFVYFIRKWQDGNRAAGLLQVGGAASATVSAIAGFGVGMHGMHHAAVLRHGAQVRTAQAAGTALSRMPVAAGLATIPMMKLLAVLFVGMALSYVFYRLAHKFDDKKNLPIEYWLDNGIFGHKALRDPSYIGLNPFLPYPPFHTLAEDLYGMLIANTEFSPLLRIEQGGNQGSLQFEMPYIQVSLPQARFGNWNERSHLSIRIWGDNTQGARRTILTMSKRGNGLPSVSQSVRVRQPRPDWFEIQHDAEQAILTVTLHPMRLYQAMSATSLPAYARSPINQGSVQDYFYRIQAEVSYIPDEGQQPPYQLQEVYYWPRAGKVDQQRRIDTAQQQMQLPYIRD